MSLRKLKEWLGRHQREIILFTLFFLISTISFALGYLAAREFNTPPIVIEQVERT